ncbi:MAG: hypothetical protein H7248_07225 [Microbacteriaceae bacterium]|nr:hypothetical protein [Microbacteriaceae bacterium]
MVAKEQKIVFRAVQCDAGERLACYGDDEKPALSDDERLASAEGAELVRQITDSRQVAKAAIKPLIRRG